MGGIGYLICILADFGPLWILDLGVSSPAVAAVGAASRLILGKTPVWHKIPYFGGIVHPIIWGKIAYFWVKRGILGGIICPIFGIGW